MKPLPLFMSRAKAAGGDDLPVMQDDRIHWNGQPVARRAGRDAGAGRPRQVADPGRPTTPSRAVTRRSRRPRRKGTDAGHRSRASRCKLEIGDAEAALAAAPRPVDATYRTPRHNHNAIELHAATLAWKGDELTRARRARRASRTRPGRSRRSSASTRRRCTSPRPTWAAASAARRCGSTRCSRRPRRSSPDGRCASRCRAKASTAWSAGAR